MPSPSAVAAESSRAASRNRTGSCLSLRAANERRSSVVGSSQWTSSTPTTSGPAAASSRRAARNDTASARGGSGSVGVFDQERGGERPSLRAPEALGARSPRRRRAGRRAPRARTGPRHAHRAPGTPGSRESARVGERRLPERGLADPRLADDHDRARAPPGRRRARLGVSRDRDRAQPFVLPPYSSPAIPAASAR